MARGRRWTGRRIVCWTAGLFLAIQILLNVAIEIRCPEIYDAEFRDRLTLLRRRTAENPDRPLLVVVGSSRTLTDFRPEILGPIRSLGDRRVLAFNFSHSGAGPLCNLMTMQRLNRAGFQPCWAVVEVVPPLLAVSGQSTCARAAEAADLPLLSAYVNPLKLTGCYFCERATTCFIHRDAYLRAFAPWCLARDSGWDALPLDRLGGTTCWLEEQANAHAPERRRAAVRAEYFPGLQHFRIADVPERAMRQLLQSCRDQGTRVALLLAPESSEFRSWYPPETASLINRYCGNLSQEYGVPIVDARMWMDDNGFIDGHHLFPGAASAFSERLARDVLEPLVYGRLPLDASWRNPQLMALSAPR